MAISNVGKSDRRLNLESFRTPKSTEHCEQFLNYKFNLLRNKPIRDSQMAHSYALHAIQSILCNWQFSRSWTKSDFRAPLMMQEAKLESKLEAELEANLKIFPVGTAKSN